MPLLDMAVGSGKLPGHTVTAAAAASAEQAHSRSCAIVGVLHKSNVFCVKEGSHSTLGLIGELGTMGSSGMMDDAILQR